MELEINIEDLLNRRKIESDRIEFKSGWNPDDIYHSIFACANGYNNDGCGYIAVGVEVRKVCRIQVLAKISYYCKRYVVIDDEIAWYGSMNFLGMEDVENNLLQVYSKEIAAGLMEMTFF